MIKRQHRLWLGAVQGGAGRERRGAREAGRHAGRPRRGPGPPAPGAVGYHEDPDPVGNGGHQGLRRADGRALRQRGRDRVIPDCHFAVQLNHFIPSVLLHSVAVVLK